MRLHVRHFLIYTNIFIHIKSTLHADWIRFFFKKLKIYYLSNKNIGKFITVSSLLKFPKKGFLRVEIYTKGFWIKNGIYSKLKYVIRMHVWKAVFLGIYGDLWAEWFSFCAYWAHPTKWAREVMRVWTPQQSWPPTLGSLASFRADPTMFRARWGLKKISTVQLPTGLNPRVRVPWGCGARV